MIIVLHGCGCCLIVMLIVPLVIILIHEALATILIHEAPATILIHGVQVIIMILGVPVMFLIRGVHRRIGALQIGIRAGILRILGAQITATGVQIGEQLRIHGKIITVTILVTVF